MTTLNINIDGRELQAAPGQTILEVAQQNDIFIPTLCFDDRTEIYGSCGLCMVEMEGNPKLWKACATVIANGMIIYTDTPKIRESRKTNLELLLSNHTGDCRPPCMQACPAHTDCQGYVGLTANGRYQEALELVKEHIPLPASIGRVCPHPCEDACRRGLIDDPVGIAWVKRALGDEDLESELSYLPEIAEETGKSVGVIGGGPYGLSLAYYLRQRGHAVTVYEAMPEAGGMLRYGIPEYRLPKAVVDAEVALIAATGVQIVTNITVGKDISFESLRETHDALALGIGAWLSTGTGAKGEDLDGVFGGIDVLRKVVRGETLQLGQRVAIVGGGNTAMDACRTAVRLGAKEVYNIYRRTKVEMPADLIEIEEAEEEGVIFKNLRNPLEIIADKNGRVSKIKLQVMELGEPDESGRRSPVAVKGKTETLAVDSVILAIGQAVDSSAFANLGLELTPRQAFKYDSSNFSSNLPGVFVGGDCGNDKISIAVEAIADAQKATEVIDAYLQGVDVDYQEPYLVERQDIDAYTFEDRERACRLDMEVLPAKQRSHNFEEVVDGWTAEQATIESQRCLECGCGDYFECKLYEYANLYDIQPQRFAGAISIVDADGKAKAPDATDDGHPFIIREEGKCILCGLCVRTCDEVVGVGALGLTGRGFGAMARPALEHPLLDSNCISCGQCVSVCPTGALQERSSLQKSVPLATTVTTTVCSHCSVGCSIDVQNHGGLLVKANPAFGGVVNQGLICGRGKFGFDCAEIGDVLDEPLVLNTAEGEMEPSSWYDALIGVAKGVQGLQARYGTDSVAVSISDRYSNEEIYAVRQLAARLNAPVFSFNNRPSAVERIFGVAASPNTMDELEHADYILAVGLDQGLNPVANIKLRQAKKNGAIVVALQVEDSALNSPHAQAGIDAEAWASSVIGAGNSQKLLAEIAAELLNNNPGRAANLQGFADLKASLDKVKVSAKASEIALAYGQAKKAMIVYQQNVLPESAAELVCAIAVLSGHFGSPRDGIVRLAPKNNSQGLYEQGVTVSAAELLQVAPKIKALLVFGEDPYGQLAVGQDLDGILPAELKATETLLEQVEFLAVCDTHLTLTAEHANVALPGSWFDTVTGTYTNTEGREQIVEPIFDALDGYKNWEIVQEIAVLAGVGDDLNWTSELDLIDDLSVENATYRNAQIDVASTLEVYPQQLFAVKARDKFISPLPSSDNLTRQIDSRLPV
jgi:formate dehydrogenase major subunit